MLMLFLVAAGLPPMVIRDAWTGLAVSATVEQAPEKAGWVYHIQAPGYAPLTFALTEPVQEVTVWLVPETPPPFPTFHPGELTLRGFVSDPSGKPLEGVRVNGTNYTDRNGMFELRLPAGEATHDHLPRAFLRFDFPGFRSLVREILAVEGSMLLKVTLQPGSGEDTLGELHGQGTGDNPPAGTPEGLLSQGTGDNPSAGTPEGLLIPPAVIRVGTNCSGRRCSSVEVMPLEFYVRSGLDEEWIASWPAHSLRAGSVAYRTYGAWYTAHPISGSYDICNNTYCQVWDGSDVYAAVVNAVKHTTGILLSHNGAYAFSEYSAENNNCGCGDGYAGTGSTWPCIPDGVDAGHRCYGHGRGMCQWGTSRWASQGKVWTWMVRHYYQPGGFTLASPVGFVSVDAFPSTVAPGDTLTLTATVISYAGDTLPYGMLGASLYRTVWVDDPARDLPVTYTPGQKTFIRRFVLPDTLSEGSWRVYLGLWLDVDKNNRINTSGGDLALALQPGPTVQVVRRTGMEEETIGRFPLEVQVFPGGVRVRSDVYQTLEVYRLDGRRVLRLRLFPGNAVTAPLPPGVFLLRTGSVVQRIVVP